MGVSNIITISMRTTRACRTPSPLIGFDSVKPSYQILKALFRRECDLQIDRDHLMIVSPDEGAIDRNIFYSSVLGIDMGLFYKRRDYTTVVDGRNPIIAHEYLGDDGRQMCSSPTTSSSGESILDLARSSKSARPTASSAAATFALFTNGLEAFRPRLRRGSHQPHHLHQPDLPHAGTQAAALVH